jgi:3',5'-cyclic AMP phosphodiesterase CpdA
MLKRLLLLVSALGSLQAADKLVGGPYAVNVGQRSATVVWITQTADAKLGTAPDVLDKSAPVLQVHKVNYTGLQAGKTYYYNAGGLDEGRGSFKTAPAAGASFKFVVYGDTRSRHAFHKRVMEAVSKAELDFVIHTGDLVADGADTAQWPIFFSIERDLLRKAAFFPCLGNHERNNPQYYDFFDVKVPYYSFDWGDAHFSVLNSDFGNVASSNEAKEKYWKEQMLWFEEDLKKSAKAALRFAVFHHPPFTAVKRRQGENPRIAQVVPLLEKHKVHAVFNGHDHNYQHHINNGVHYIVTGGGGAPLYPVDGPLEGITQKVESTEHFVQVTVEGAKVRIQAFGLDGRIIDTVEF